MARSKCTVLSLNIWGGRALDRIEWFLQSEHNGTPIRDQVDVFCFQEVFHTEQHLLDARHPEMSLAADCFTRIAAALPNHEGRFAGHEDEPVRMGLAVFVNKAFSMSFYNHFEVFKPEVPVETGHEIISSRLLQVVEVYRDDGTDEDLDCTAIANFHGLYVLGGHKLDTPERLATSHKINWHLDPFRRTGLVICGDFNLEPQTESLRLLADGMQNPIVERGITSTRTELYRKFGDPGVSLHADYALVSPEVRLSSFEVLPHRVSDHAGLLFTVE